jgi:hypothetical protein
MENMDRMHMQGEWDDCDLPTLTLSDAALEAFFVRQRAQEQVIATELAALLRFSKAATQPQKQHIALVELEVWEACTYLLAGIDQLQTAIEGYLALYRGHKELPQAIYGSRVAVSLLWLHVLDQLKRLQVKTHSYQGLLEEMEISEATRQAHVHALRLATAWVEQFSQSDLEIMENWRTLIRDYHEQCKVVAASAMETQEQEGDHE